VLKNGSVSNYIIAGSKSDCKVHPVMAEKVLKERLDLSYRVWLALRAHDPDGTGLWTWSDAKTLIADELQIMSTKTIYRAIKSDVFFFRSNGYVTTRSLDVVCLSLNVKPRQPVYIPLSALRGVVAFRSSVLAASFASENSLDFPTSLKTIAMRVGRSERTVWSWLRKADVHIEHNSLASNMPPQIPDDELASQGWYRSKQSDGTVEMRRRLQNSYHSQLKQAPKGRARKIRIELPDKNGCRVPVQFMALRKRDAQKAVKAIHQMGEGDAVYALWRPPTPRDKDGARLWEGHQMVNGEVRFM